MNIIGGGMRSRPGAARTILLFHTRAISVRPSKQPQHCGVRNLPKGIRGLILKKNSKHSTIIIRPSSPDQTKAQRTALAQRASRCQERVAAQRAGAGCHARTCSVRRRTAKARRCVPLERKQSMSCCETNRSGAVQSLRLTGIACL